MINARHREWGEGAFGISSLRGLLPCFGEGLIEELVAIGVRDVVGIVLIEWQFHEIFSVYHIRSVSYLHDYRVTLLLFFDKIIYIKVTDLPDISIKGKKDYKLLSLQMENLFKGIKSAKPNDLIIFSDEDEIPNPNIINGFNFNNHKFGIFLQNMYYYKLNIMNIDEGNGNWPGSRICQKKNLKSFFKLRLLKIKNLKYPFWRIDKEKNIELIKNGGWHFTYLMKPQEISKKIQDMAHTEFNKEKFKDISYIENNIINLKDPFNRDLNLRKTDIDDSFPDYIKKNKELFKEWILQ